MNLLHTVSAFILLISVVAGMIRIFAGPSLADRMMAAQLFGTCGVAILLLLAGGGGAAVLVDIALVFALLAALVVMTFVYRAWSPEEKDNADHS